MDAFILTRLSKKFSFFKVLWAHKNSNLGWTYMIFHMCIYSFVQTGRIWFGPNGDIVSLLILETINSVCWSWIQYIRLRSDNTNVLYQLFKFWYHQNLSELLKTMPIIAIFLSDFKAIVMFQQFLDLKGNVDLKKKKFRTKLYLYLLALYFVSKDVWMLSSCAWYN